MATPIGNLSDMTFRALQVLREADEILAEDTRHTRKLLSALEVRADRRLSSYHEHNKLDKLDKVDLLASNPTRSVALVCDAGTPTVSDPGSELVHRARTLGVRVHCVPGPCAFAAALSASGCVSKMDSARVQNIQGACPKLRTCGRRLILNCFLGPFPGPNG